MSLAKFEILISFHLMLSHIPLVAYVTQCLGIRFQNTTGKGPVRIEAYQRSHPGSSPETVDAIDVLRTIRVMDKDRQRIDTQSSLKHDKLSDSTVAVRKWVNLQTSMDTAI